MAYVAQEEPLDDEDISLQPNGPAQFPFSGGSGAEPELDLALDTERESLYASLNVPKNVFYRQ